MNQNKKQKKKAIVQGHRGGFKPDNTLRTFQKSLESGLEAIELDVWLSRDGVPIVSHGGSDGNMVDYGYSSEFIYDWNLRELQTLVAAEGETIPTLQ